MRGKLSATDRAIRLSQTRSHSSPDKRSTQDIIMKGGEDPPWVSIRKRLSWSVRDREFFTHLVADLMEFNNGLFALVPTGQRNFLSEVLKAEVVSAKTTSDELEMTEVSVDPSDSGMQSVISMKTLSLEADTPPLDRPWLLQRVKLPVSSVLINDDGQSKIEAQNWVFGIFAKTNGARQLPVLIEWKPYDFQLAGTKAFAMALRIDELARVLHESSKIPRLETLPCIGYIEDLGKARFGFVFESPQAQLFGYPQHPRSLNGIIEMSSRLPPLEQRFQLATKLVKTLYNFHCANWLHRELSSHKILFANVAKDRLEPNLSEPFLLGFSHARLEDHESMSSELHVHTTDDATLYEHPYLLSSAPNQRPRYCRAFDVYSLGCVLLEIGLWRRLKELWKRKYSDNPEVWAKRLAENWARELRGKCGGTYEDLVRSCLLVNISAATNQPNSLVEFCWTVLGKLEGLRV